ncbi:glycosyltransferase family 39 protein [Streptomyces sp. NPDC002935]|uniref:glycosyltransferase family 39 protein n=1 Tax=Streptomyces sp. NPDC002935 TaxID=3154545 RepID=UPI0033AC392B
MNDPGPANIPTERSNRPRTNVRWPKAEHPDGTGPAHGARSTHNTPLTYGTCAPYDETAACAAGPQDGSTPATTDHHGLDAHTSPAAADARGAALRPSGTPASASARERADKLWARLCRAARQHGPVLALYGAMKLIGFCVFMYLLDSSGDFRRKNPRFGGGAHVWDVLATWDGWWYQQIAAHGYHPELVPIPGATGLITLEGNSAAFFPLYPALMRLVSSCTGLGLLGAGLVVSIAASFVAALAVYAVTARISGRRAGLAAAGLWAVWPGSGMEWSGYSESLYIALAAWACYAVMRRNWLTAGLLTCAAGLTRPTATALIAALTVAALVDLLRDRRAVHRWGDIPALDGTARRDAVLRPLTAVVIAPVGLAGYLGWVGHRMGDYGGYFELQDGAWAHSFDYGRHTLKVFSSLMVGHFDYLYAYPYEDAIGAATVLLALIILPLLFWLRPPVVLTVYTLLTMALVLGSQQIFGNVSRYLLPAFPLLIPCATAMRRLSTPVLCSVLTIAALASGSYAGYVLFEVGIP